MEMDFQKDPSQCGMWKADCGIKRRKGRKAPSSANRIPVSCPIEFYSAKEEFTKEFQLL